MPVIVEPVILDFQGNFIMAFFRREFHHSTSQHLVILPPSDTMNSLDLNDLTEKELCILARRVTFERKRRNVRHVDKYDVNSHITFDFKGQSGVVGRIAWKGRGRDGCIRSLTVMNGRLRYILRGPSLSTIRVAPPTRPYFQSTSGRRCLTSPRRIVIAMRFPEASVASAEPKKDDGNRHAKTMRRGGTTR